MIKIRTGLSRPIKLVRHSGLRTNEEEIYKNVLADIRETTMKESTENAFYGVEADLIFLVNSMIFKDENRVVFDGKNYDIIDVSSPFRYDNGLMVVALTTQREV